MKKTKQLCNTDEKRKSREDEYHIYSFDVTKKLLEKYKASKGVITIESRREKSENERAA